MEWIRGYFNDLFMSDATLGLDVYDEHGNMNAYMDSDGSYVIIARDSQYNEYPEGDRYEIRIRKL